MLAWLSRTSSTRARRAGSRASSSRALVDAIAAGWTSNATTRPDDSPVTSRASSTVSHPFPAVASTARSPSRSTARHSACAMSVVRPFVRMTSSRWAPERETSEGPAAVRARGDERGRRTTFARGARARALSPGRGVSRGPGASAAGGIRAGDAIEGRGGRKSGGGGARDLRTPVAEKCALGCRRRQLANSPDCPHTRACHRSNNVWPLNRSPPRDFCFSLRHASSVDVASAGSTPGSRLRARSAVAPSLGASRAFARGRPRPVARSASTRGVARSVLVARRGSRPRVLPRPGRILSSRIARARRSLARC